ncbi:MAG: enoyl-CoA hydratase/isomerase family protein [Sporichthyaceae bacterium]
MTDALTVPATPSVAYVDDVAVLSLGSGEGRFNDDSVAALAACFDEILANAKAMVTVADSKIWSNGLDVDWLLANPDRAGGAIQRAEQLFGRIMAAPIPTVAALGGHVFAGGVFLAMAHDVRIMRADRGFICLPEVDMGVVFTRGMIAQLQATMTPATAHKAMVFGHRFAAAEAVASGLVAEAVDLEGLLPRALELATAMSGKDRSTLAELKTKIYADAISALGAEPPSNEMLRTLGVKVN